MSVATPMLAVSAAVVCQSSWMTTGGREAATTSHSLHSGCRGHQDFCSVGCSSHSSTHRSLTLCIPYDFNFLSQVFLDLVIQFSFQILEVTIIIHRDDFVRMTCQSVVSDSGCGAKEGRQSFVVETNSIRDWQSIQDFSS